MDGDEPLDQLPSFGPDSSVKRCVVTRKTPSLLVLSRFSSLLLLMWHSIAKLAAKVFVAVKYAFLHTHVCASGHRMQNQTFPLTRT